MLAKLLAVFVVFAFLAAPAAAQVVPATPVDRLYLPMFPVGNDSSASYSFRLRLSADLDELLVPQTGRPEIGNDGLVLFRDHSGRPLDLGMVTAMPTFAPGSFRAANAIFGVRFGSFQLSVRDIRPLVLGSLEVVPKMEGVRGLGIIEVRDAQGNLSNVIEAPLARAADWHTFDAEWESSPRIWVSILNPGAASVLVRLRTFVRTEAPSIVSRGPDIKEVAVQVASRSVFTGFLDDPALFGGLKGAAAVEVAGNRVVVNAYRVGARTTLIPVYSK